MVSVKDFSKLALSFPATTQEPHFEKSSFRVHNKIFATLAINSATVVVKLTPEDQSVFCAFDKEVMWPVDGSWGKQGWTKLDLTKIRKTMLSDTLTQAWCTVAPKKLAEAFRAGTGL